MDVCQQDPLQYSADIKKKITKVGLVCQVVDYVDLNMVSNKFLL